MLALSEKQMLIQALGKCVYDEVQTAIAPFIERMANCEKIIAAFPIPEKGENGKDGKDGKDAVIDAEQLQAHLQTAVEKHFEKYPIFSGKDGKDGKDGADGKDAIIPFDYLNEQLSAGMEMLSEQLNKKIEALPKPEKGDKGDKGDPGEPGKDGANGRDGRDGIDGKNLSLDDIRACLAELVVKAIGDIPRPRNCMGGYIDRSGHLFLSFSDGSVSDLGEVTGKDGKDCDLELVRSQVAEFLAAIEKPRDGRDGRDGVGFDDLQLDFNGSRLVQLKFIKDEVAKVFNLNFPVPIFKGIWKEGDYEQSDIVVRDGSMWIALQRTKAMPGLPESGWQLCTKRGRDGKDGKIGPEGKEGKPGRDGRDLTQMGFDGVKY